MISLSLEKFLALFWSNEICRNIFLLHKEQLLEKDVVEALDGSKTHYYSPRFVISNSLIRKDLHEKLQKRVEHRELDLGHHLGHTTERNFDQQKIEAYFNKLFSHPIKEVSKKIDAGNIQQVKFLMEATSALLSEKRFIKFLQKYKIAPVEINSIDDLARHFESLFKTEVSKLFTPERISDVLASLDNITSYYQNAYVKDLMEANNFYTDFLYDKDNYKSRISFFDILYEASILVGGKFKGYYECTQCDPGIFNGSITVKATPSKLKLRCPVCGSETYFIVPYEIHDDIFQLIKHKDGLLLHVIKLSIEKNGWMCASNVNLSNDVEADICVYNNNLISDVIEIKMFKTDRPEDTIVKNLEESLNNLIRNRQKLINENQNWINVQFHLITNITIDATIAEVRNTFQNQIANTKVFIYTPMQFKESALKKKS